MHTLQDRVVSAHLAHVLSGPMVCPSIAHVYICTVTVKPPNKGHFRDNINSADLFFVERYSSLGGSKQNILEIILGPEVVSLVERFNNNTIVCPYLESPLSEVPLYTYSPMHI